MFKLFYTLFVGTFRIARRFEYFNRKVGKEARNLPEDWTGDLVGLMHTHRITNKRLADHLGITDRYVSMVLNGKREPPDAEARFSRAVQEMISLQDHSTMRDVR